MYDTLPSDYSLLCDLRSRMAGTISTETLRLLKFSVLANTYQIFEGYDHRPSGYIAWASVNVETVLRLERTGAFPAYYYEWEEGDIFLVLDLLLLPSSGTTPVARLRPVLADREYVAYVRTGKLCVLRNENGRLKKNSISQIVDRY